MPAGRPATPMLPNAAIGRPAPPLEAAADGAVSIEFACERYLGGIGRSAFYELVAAGEIELVHEGRRSVVPVRQLVLRLARKIAAERRAASAGARTGHET
jgi:hypothetical protein